MQQLLIASEESFQNGRALFWSSVFARFLCFVFHVFDDITDFTLEDLAQLIQCFIRDFRLPAEVGHDTFAENLFFAYSV